MLADLVRVGYLPKVWLAPEDVRQLRTLVRYRQQLVNQRRAIKLRITALLRDARVVEPKGSRRWGRAWLAWLATAEGLGHRGPVRRRPPPRRAAACSTSRSPRSRPRLAKVTAEDPVIAQLVPMKGVGLVTAWALRAEIGRFDRFTHRQAAGAVLRADAAERLERPAAGRRGADQGRQRAAAGDIIEAAHRLIRFDARGAAGGEAAGGGQAGERGGGGGGQPLGALAVPPGRKEGAITLKTVG